MGNKSTKSIDKSDEFLNAEAMKDFYNFYQKGLKNPKIFESPHIVLDYFQAHYFSLIKFARLNNLSENELWGVVRKYGNSYNCLCIECHPDLYEK